MTAKKALRALIIALALWISGYSAVQAVGMGGDPAVPVYWLFVVLYWILPADRGALTA